MRPRGILVLLLACALAVPARAAAQSALDANDVDASWLGAPFALPRALAEAGAPVSLDLDRPGAAAGVRTPWGRLDVSLTETPYNLPFRLRLDPRPEPASAAPALPLVPYLAVGRIEGWDGDVPEGVRSLGQDRAPLKTAAGLTLGLGRNAEITGEYQFLGLHRAGAALGPSALDRNFATGPDSFGVSFSLSIKY